MDITDTLGYLEKQKENYYEWFHDSVWTKRILLALLVAAVTGIAAQIRIPLGFTPVPITGQVFAVLLCGVILGNVNRTVHDIIYHNWFCWCALVFRSCIWLTNRTHHRIYYRFCSSCIFHRFSHTEI